MTRVSVLLQPHEVAVAPLTRPQSLPVARRTGLDVLPVRAGSGSVELQDERLVELLLVGRRDGVDVAGAALRLTVGADGADPLGDGRRASQCRAGKTQHEGENNKPHDLLLVLYSIWSRDHQSSLSEDKPFITTKAGLNMLYKGRLRHFL